MAEENWRSQTALHPEISSQFQMGLDALRPDAVISPRVAGRGISRIHCVI
jgi:hypothetical protein